MPSPISDWPIAVLTPKHPAFWPSGGVKKGPDSVSQLQLLDTLDGGPIWEARYAMIPVYCRSRILAAQAIQGLAMQGVGLFRVWRYPGDRSPSPGLVDGVPFSDGATFSDGSLFAGVSMAASMVAAAELFDSVVEITADQPLEAGMEFSLFDAAAGWRMHRIVRVLSEDGEAIVAEIIPPLRFDVIEGQYVDFVDPSCTMRMTNASTFLQMLEWNEYADLTAEFEEARW